jgi:hypothetical protein
MNPWRRTRSELAGAWRSVRYDLGRRRVPAAPQPAPVADVTSTGLSTFGGPLAEDLSLGFDPGYRRRPPRRAVAVSAFGVLTVAGAVGSYFAVVNGVGSLLSAPAAGTPYPLAAAAPTTKAEAAATAGMGRGSAERPNAGRARAGTPAPTVTVAVPAGTAPVRVHVLPRTPHTAPARRTTAAGGPDCDCLTPPVPTPTAPSPPGPRSPSPSPSPTSASPSESPTASAEPSRSDEGAHGGHGAEH